VVTGFSNCSAANARAVEAPPRPGDQIKIRLNCRPGAADGWATTEAALARWAADRGIIIAGTEVIVESPHIRSDVDPEQFSNRMLIDFANQERLSNELANIGLALFKEV
jgi:hypothetical protein